MRPFRSLSFPLVLVVSAAALAAQHEAPAESFGHSRHAKALDEGPRQAAYRMAGMSEQVHLPVQGLSAEAQGFFDQAITQLHGFWYFEAERSFRQVLKLAPDCAMAWWGIALCNREQPERAVASIAEAVRRSAAVPRYEQLWIDAFAAYYQVDDAARTELRADAERFAKARDALVAKNKDRAKDLVKKQDQQLVKDLGTLVYEFPDCLEAKALLAIYVWHAYDWGGGVPIVSHAAVDALLELVFQKAPRHPAHHYRIHLWDAEKGERALRSAAAIGDSAPGIAHQWHMAGHIYAKLNRHAEAAWQQEASGRVDHAHMGRDRVMPFLIHNYGHNQEWLARSLSHLGRVDEALQIAKNLAELPRHPKWNRLSQGDEIAGYARTRLLQLCEDHELWAQALQLAADGLLEPDEDVRVEAWRLALLGRANYRLGRRDAGAAIERQAEALLQKARQQRAAAIDTAEAEALARRDERSKVDGATDAAQKKHTEPVRAVLEVQQELRGERLLAEGDAKGARDAFAAIDGFSKLLLADAHLAAGEPQRAVELLQPEVEKNPHRVPSLARLLLAHQAVGDEPSRQKARDLAAELVAMLPPEQLQGPQATPLLQRVGLGVDAPRAAPAGDRGETGGFPADFGPRPPLATLGPVTWTPPAAPALALPSSDGGTFRLGDRAGRATLVVFYLGFGCLHCVQQLQALAPAARGYAAAGIDIVAVGNESLAKVQDHLAALGDNRLPFPLLADPELQAFRAFRCHDDFEGMPLHGTFLVDAAGRIRWQDISYEPFVQVDWLLAESRRLLALPAAAGAGTK